MQQIETVNAKIERLQEQFLREVVMPWLKGFEARLIADKKLKALK